MTGTSERIVNKADMVALVFGASGEQGRAVLEGMVDAGYKQVFGFSRQQSKYITDALGCTLITGDLANPDDVRKALEDTKAQAIFLVTTTELPIESSETTACSTAMEAEYEVIVEFFQILLSIYQEDKLPRHVIFSVMDNVQKICRAEFDETGQTLIVPMDDGSIVPHYSAKGRGGEYAANLLRHIDGLDLTQITLPFAYSNFLGFFAPLPDDGKTQWQLSACFGDGANKIDMMSLSDLSTIVPNIFERPKKYEGQNLRLSACKISMDEIAADFASLFGKDVIYNPLTPEEVSALPFPSAEGMAQMCQFLADQPPSLEHDVELTREVLFPRKAQTFKDWLLTHSDSLAFRQVGLDIDAPEINSVVVFGATSLQGISVIKGLLADKRKSYNLRATTWDMNSEKAKALEALDPERVTLVQADLDDVESCIRAAEGMQGAFLVTDFYEDADRDMAAEERHAKNVIDACEASHSVRHLVFSTIENIEELNHELELGLNTIPDKQGKEGIVLQFDAKAKAAAYARTKKLSVTYVLMPCYSEMFFDLMEERVGEDGKTKMVLTVPLKDRNTKVMCMSIDDLGPAVANIFDSYQVYAGHEIGLVTDFVTMTEFANVLNDVFYGSTEKEECIEAEEVSHEHWSRAAVQAKDTYMKDLGQMFAYLSHTDAVKKRHSIARTMKLVPSARPLRLWVEQNRENDSFREKLGLR